MMRMVRVMFLGYFSCCIISGNLIAQIDDSRVSEVLKILEKGESYLSNGMIDSLEVEAENARILSKHISYPEGEVQSLILLGKGAIFTRDYPQSLEYLHQADSICQVSNLDDYTHQVLLELGHTYYNLKKFRRSLEYYRKVYALASNQNYSLKYTALSGQANILNNISSHHRVIPVLQEALNIAKGLGDSHKQIETLNQLATIYFSVGELDSARLFFEQLLDLKRDMGDTHSLISDLNQYGDMFLRQGAYDKAQTYLFEALSLTEELGDSLLMVSIITNIGESFIQQENWIKAWEYAEMGVSMSEKRGIKQMEAVNWKNGGLAKYKLEDSEGALFAYQQALSIYKNAIRNQTEIVKLQLSMAELLEGKADYQQALSYLKEALAVKRRHNDKLNILDIQLTMAGIYLSLNQSQSAVMLLENCEALSKEIKSKSAASKVYQMLAEAYAQRQDYQQAYSYYQQHSHIRDSLFNEEREKIIQESEQKYLKEREIRENAELEAEIATKQLEIEKNKSIILQKTQHNYILNGGIGLLSMLVIFLWYRYVKRRQLLQQKLIALEKIHETENLRSFIGGEQKERQRIARELHDGLGALLASIKLLFNAVQNEAPFITSNTHFHRADQLLNHACQEVREISHNMMPGILDQYGLEQAIRDLCDVINHSSPMDIAFLSYGLESSLEDEINISVYRIIQELLSNVVKHSEAQEAIVQIDLDDDMLRITVEDDGKGFDKDRMLDQGGIGLKNLQSRVVYLHGNMEIDTNPGHGCTIYLEIPVQTTQVGKGTEA